GMRMDALAKRPQSIAAQGLNAANATGDYTGPHSSARVKANTRRNWRVASHATVAVSYRVRDRALYFYAHSPAYYAEAFHAGHITQAELAEIFANIDKMA